MSGRRWNNHSRAERRRRQMQRASSWRAGQTIRDLVEMRWEAWVLRYGELRGMERVKRAMVIPAGYGLGEIE